MSHVVAVVATSALLAMGLSVAAAPSADAATRHATSVSLKSITDTTGSRTISGDKVTLAGTASKNLIGKTLHVELKKGSRWVSYAGSARVSSSRSFKMTSRATGVGKQVYRVSFAGTSQLKASVSSRSVTVWKWYPLVDQDIVSDVEPWGGDEPHELDQATVAGVRYSHLLGAVSDNAATGSSDFNLGYHCVTFSSTIGLADNSVTGASDIFTFFLDGNQAAQQTLALGRTANINLDVSGIFRIRLQQAAVLPDAATLVSAYPTWPSAKVLCSGNP